MLNSFSTITRHIFTLSSSEISVSSAIFFNQNDRYEKIGDWVDELAKIASRTETKMERWMELVELE